MRIRVLQHVAFESPANIAAWAKDRGHDLAVTRMDLGELPPAPAAYDLLVVMGGPMSVWEELPHPFLTAEKEHIRLSLARGKKLVGICLGAQLLADALGGGVKPGGVQEIGWHPVHLTADARCSSALRGFPSNFEAFHWHGDTFHALPAGSHLLARSAACAHQAFALGDLALGLQFHLETSEESMEALIAACGAGLVPSASVQDATTMRARAKAGLAPLKDLLYRLLDNFTE